MFRVLKIIPNAHSQDIWAVAWHGDSILSGSLDQQVKLWKVGENDAAEPRLLSGHNLAVISVDISSDGKRGVSCGLDCVVHFWDLESGKPVSSVRNAPGECWAVRFSPDGKRLASSSKHGNVQLWDVASGKKTAELEATNKFTTCVAWNHDGTALACGSIDGSVCVFQVGEEGSKRVHKIEAHAKPVRDVAFTRDSQFVLSASDDAHVSMWDLQHANLVHSFSGHAGGVTTLAVSEGGKYFASGGMDGKVRIWDVASRTCVYTFSEHKDQVWGLSFNDKGDSLVSCSDDRSIIRYDVQ